MWQFQILVFQNVDSKRENKRLFERVVEVNDALSIPFSSLLSDLKFLFGSSCIVTFNIL